ncbi:hypothetical protein BXP70_08080 [Hymenobacter crusticola]|uniref:SbsA Ig-like domain-containing protein n=1 Tax=Hymenobacter crusticola TaxID=1770526 RepID=A0A243WG30_9BACT|nr:hypothetical protein BXP70_08080 [Hymenobacter crusticola]
MGATFARTVSTIGIVSAGLIHSGQAQTLAVAGLEPGRNALAAPCATSVVVRFQQALHTGLATQQALHVFGGVASGKKAGTGVVSGSTLSFKPSTSFSPGETVGITLTTAAQSSTGGALARPQVFQFTTATGHGPGTFSGNQEVLLPSAPHNVVMGDVDSDGDLDLLTANPSANTVSVRLNDGRGVFSGNQTVAVGNQPDQVVLADVDSDGDLDLLTANYGVRLPLPGSVSVRLNDGKGHFSAGSDVAVSANLTRLTTGDLDGDGDLDLVAASNSSTNGTLTVHLNDGQGHFNAGTVVGGPANDVVLGDVDADGDLDLLVTRADVVTIRLNNGKASFPVVQTATVGGVATTLVLGDLDNDGDLDLLTSNNSSDFNGTVSVRLNDGFGSFSGTQEVIVGAGPSLKLGDIDGDGDLDLVTANYGAGTGNTVSVRLNNGLGSFSGAQEVAVGTGAVGAALGDLDGDGDLDLATAISGSSAISVRFNQHLPAPTLLSAGPKAAAPVGGSISLKGTYFTPTSTVTFGGVTATQVIVVSATQLTAVVPAGATTGVVRVANAAGVSNEMPFVVSLTVSPTAPARNALATTLTTPVVLAFNQSLSQALATQTALKVFSQQAGGVKTGTANVGGSTLTFAPTTKFRAGETVFATLTAAAQSTTNTPATPQVFQFTTATIPSPGVFSGRTEVTLGTNVTAQTVGDVDGDGDLDLLVAEGANNAVSVRLNDGTGHFAGSQRVAVGDYPNSVVLGDVDGDGDLDLLTTNYASGTVSVCLNNGAGTFSSTGQAVYVKDNLTAIALGDVDGDADLDLLVANGASANVTSTVSVLLNDGRGFFSRKQDVAVGNYPASLAVGDIDADGDLDLLVGNQVSNSVSVRFNDGLGLFSGTQELAENVPYRVQLSDVDGDGDLDLLTANIQEGHVHVRLNTGGGNFDEGQVVAVGAYPNSLVLGDIDGDGDLDLLTASNSMSTVSVRLNDSHGVFNGTQEVSVSYAAQNLALADLDGNGTLDVVAASYEGKTVSVRLNQRKEQILGTATTTALASQVSLYPNPAHASVRLLIPASFARQGVHVRVLNPLGQLVSEQNWTAQQAASSPELTLTALAPGAYSICLGTTQGMLVKRLIVE